MKLYDLVNSGNCHKVRLLLGFLDLPYEKIPVDTAKGEQRTPEFLAINPMGHVPVLAVDGKYIWESTPIMVYIARNFGRDYWLPLETNALTEITKWLAVALCEVRTGLAKTRSITQGRRQGNLDETRELGAVALRALESRLKDNDWLALDHPTLADLACYPHVALAPEGGIRLDGYPGVVRWIDRIQNLPGYVGMPGLPYRPVRA
ncbi:glutathione S-transferase family protein [Candidatus Berkelbacteria bacterium]|nr:glutathione S-transferase family protein [Candidatus Berkelbacteria bacterium]